MLRSSPHVIVGLCVPLVLVVQIADNNILLLLDALHIRQLRSTMNFKTVLNDKCFKKYQI